MSIFQAVVYGLVQGLGEFLPISSSAHLVLVPWLFGWEDPGLTFDIALHAGTLVAVVLYFLKDWLRLIFKGFTDVRSTDGRLFWYLVAATIPGAIGGYHLEKQAETVFRSPLLVGPLLIIMGLLLYWADKKGAKRTRLRNIRFGQSLLIGASQVLAVIPGVSRSGVTITAGLLSGITREGAARFSFLLSTPIVVGAVLIKVPEILRDPSALNLEFGIGMAVSFMSGLASIGFLLRYLQTRDFLPFVWYRSLVGILVIVIALMR